MRDKTMVTACAALALVMLTSSCGWHLRGQQSIASIDSASSHAPGLSLTANDIYTPLYRTFKSDYENRRVDLANTENQPQLKLLDEKIKTRILSLNTELDPAENELTYSIHYQITLSGQQPQIYNVHLYRTYTENKNRATARDNEINKLTNEMRHEAAERILNQINTLLHQQKLPPEQPKAVDVNTAP